MREIKFMAGEEKNRYKKKYGNRKKMLIIGDVHYKTDKYKKIINKYEIKIYKFFRFK